MRGATVTVLLALVAIATVHVVAIERSKHPLTRLSNQINAASLLEVQQVSESASESAAESGSGESTNDESSGSGSEGSATDSTATSNSLESSLASESGAGSGSGSGSVSESDSTLSSLGSGSEASSGSGSGSGSASSNSIVGSSGSLNPLSSSSQSLSSGSASAAMSLPPQSVSLPAAGTTSSDDPAARKDAEEKAQRERELDWARHRKDAEEQAGKKERLLQMQMVDQLKKARLDADNSAKRILADAQAKAKEMLDNAKPPAAPVDEKKKAEHDAKNSILLKPVNGGGDDGLDPHSLGLAPQMSVDTNLISRGLDLTKKADARHDKFEDQHEIDCKGPICAKGGGKVNAEAH